MAQLVFHYTSCQAAQEIAIHGAIVPGRGGKLYLTDDTYARGVDAARRLAIPNKAVEMVFVVEQAGLSNISDPRPVGPYRGPAGVKLRPGGGTERWTEHEISVPAPVAWNLSTL